MADQEDGSQGSTDSRDSDESLARAVVGGDLDAWDAFFDRFLPWTYRFAFYHLRMNHADAEDLCSDILETGAKSIGKYDATRGGLDVWMLGLARHRLARFCRRRHMEVPETPEVIESAAQRSIPENRIADQVLTRDQVHRVLASLPERQSAVLVGKYLQGYSVDELAGILETTPKAVEMLLRRARHAFRAAFCTMTGGDENV